MQKLLQQQNEKLIDQKSDYIKIASSWISDAECSFLNEKEYKKRILELAHVASFAIALKNHQIIEDVTEISIANLSIEPDFIISFQNERIGLEVRRVMNDQAQEVGIKKGILNSAKRIFEQKHPETKVFVSISFKKSFVSYGKNVQISEQIADFVYSQVTGGQIKKPDFVNRARCVLHTKLSFNLSGGYWVGNLDEEIKKGIKDKNKKIKSYKTKANLEKIWLLLVVSGNSPDSDFSHFDETTFVCDNSFDFVFLLNDFKKELYFLTKDKIELLNQN